MIELSAQEWLDKLRELPRPGTDSVLAFYEHRMGGLCRDPRLMLVPLDDHLVHRGDGVFEALRLAGGRVLHLDAHMSRLRDSCAAIDLTPPCSWDEIRAILLDVAHAGGSPDGALRLLIGRGGGGLGVDPAECPEASLFVVASRTRPLPESYWARGLTACRSAVPAKQPWLARIKSTNYLPNVLMTAEARARGADVSFCFDDHGFLAEAAIANVGLVDARGRLIVPEFRHALPGTTALLAMRLAEDFMPVLRRDVSEDDLFAAREILLWGTTPECVGITRYEERPVGGGVPGPAALRLRGLIHEALIAEGVPF